jgi:hypothetical protein
VFPSFHCRIVLSTPFIWYMTPWNWVIISRRFELTCVSIFMGLQFPVGGDVFKNNNAFRRTGVVDPVTWGRFANNVTPIFCVPYHGEHCAPPWPLRISHSVKSGRLGASVQVEQAVECLVAFRQRQWFFFSCQHSDQHWIPPKLLSGFSWTHLTEYKAAGTWTWPSTVDV